MLRGEEATPPLRQMQQEGDTLSHSKTPPHTTNARTHPVCAPAAASLWTGFGFSFFASVVFIGISALSEKPKNAIFNHLATLLAVVMALVYLIEALGQTEMYTVRPLLWLRYVRE